LTLFLFGLKLDWENIVDKEKFVFWQDHALAYLEMAFRTDKRKVVENPDGYGKKKGECKDSVEIFITVKGSRIEALFYDVDGCMNTNACANAVAFLVEGKTIEEAWETTPEIVADFLQSLPENHFHCAELTVGALYLALSNYQQTLIDSERTD
jgi:nitrogen fixation protein NifU and related proteins